MLSKKVAQVNKSRCVSCGACTKECPKNAISVQFGCYALVHTERCVGCGKCTKVCPADCISLQERSVQA